MPITRGCGTCKGVGVGVVWAAVSTYPRGFRQFAASLPRTDDRRHVEVACPACGGQSPSLPPEGEETPR